MTFAAARCGAGGGKVAYAGAPKGARKITKAAAPLHERREGEDLG